MKILKSYSIGRLHELAVDYIYHNGKEVRTENGEMTLQTQPLCLVTETPFDEYRISVHSPFNKAFMDKYTNDLLYGCESEFSYTYHERLFENPNQINYIVKKLLEEPTTRRAVACTWRPEHDEKEPNCPCLQYVQCTLNDGQLDMTVLFRSNDMLSALGSNMYALTYLQKYIAELINYPVGTYTHISIVPHIYHIRDASDLERFVK